MTEAQQPASEGRIVHFKVGTEGRCIPAMVVKAWGPDTVNLQVFFDGTNDRQYARDEDEARRGVGWRTSVVREGSYEGAVVPATTSPTWHWPERVEVQAASPETEEVPA